MRLYEHSYLDTHYKEIPLCQVFVLCNYYQSVSHSAYQSFSQSVIFYLNFTMNYKISRVKCVLIGTPWLSTRDFTEGQSRNCMVLSRAHLKLVYLPLSHPLSLPLPLSSLNEDHFECSIVRVKCSKSLMPCHSTADDTTCVTSHLVLELGVWPNRSGCEGYLTQPSLHTELEGIPRCNAFILSEKRDGSANMYVLDTLPGQNEMSGTQNENRVQHC